MSDDELRRSLGELGADAEATLDELRSLAHGVYPAVLVDHGLAPALTSVAGRSPLPVHVEAALAGASHRRSRRPSTSAAWRRSRTRPSTPAPCATVTVSIREHGGRVAFEIRDDGVGFDVDDVHGGHGLTNLHDRVAAVGGDVHVASGRGAGTTVSGDVPATSAITRRG